MTLDVLENTLGPIIEYNKRVLEEDKEAEK